MIRSATWMVVLVCAHGVGRMAGAAPDSPPVFGDWNFILPDGWREVPTGGGGDPCVNMPPLLHDPLDISPINQPGGGHGGPTYEPGAWMAWYATCLAQQQDDAGAPIAFMVRNRNCPHPYATGGHSVDPESVRHALDALPKLDYLLMDLELFNSASPDMVELNAMEVVRLVRSHPNPRVASAFIGNYADSPNRFDEALIWPSQRDRTQNPTFDGGLWDRHSLYHSLFDLAMPSAYPNEAFSVHTNDYIQSGNTAPNDHAAMFWAPLERISASARELPDGHRLMPWITNHVQLLENPDQYHAPPLGELDLLALVQHTRMRGAVSYMIWTSNDGPTDHPFIDYEHFRAIAGAAWRSIEPYFSAVTDVEFLNLSTDKRSGVQWSAVRAGDQVGLLVSNLLEADDARVGLPMIGGLPARTPLVGPGEHRFFSFDCRPAVRDWGRDGTVNDDDFVDYVVSYYGGLPDAPNTVGGAGGDWRDIDGNGVVGLEDLIVVAEAYWAGEFARFADEWRQSLDGDSGTIDPR